MSGTKGVPSLWSGMDRKALAIGEFTLRQQRKRLSTWVVLIVGIAAMGVLTMFYVDAMTRDYEAIDNDGDSYDWDGDGYPNGQEQRYGTDIFDENSHPGVLDPSILPDDPSVWINEDDFDWDALEVGSVGYDDNGDCDVDSRTASQKDANNNGIPCDIRISTDRWNPGTYVISSDGNVDEDPDDEAYALESIHRSFVLAIGKLGVVFLIGIFVPLFMATGLIRNEMTSGTMHFMLAKPIARGEVFLYRLLGFYALAWVYLTLLIALLALITGFAGPGEGIFRFSDLGVWMSVWLASVLAIMVYGMLFCTLGVMWKHGMVLALPFAAWELGMILTTLGAPDAAILRFSVIGWAMNIVDAGAALAWSDTPLMIQMGLWGGGNGSLEGAEALNIFWSRPGLDLGALGTIIVSVFVLLFQTAACWLLGSALFKSKEIE
jgi:ABC-type transport system involved in multi-copper enzyme maturation permease subunit